MKKPLFALPAAPFFLVIIAAELAGFGADPASSRLRSAVGAHFLRAAKPDFMISSACMPRAVSLSEGTTADSKPVKKVEVLVLDPGGPGGAGSVLIKLGFLIELEPGWHIYWVNSGDAGLAPNVRWTLPPGFKAGPLLHPVPKKSVKEGIVSFAHAGPVLLTCDITPPASFSPTDTWEASAVLEWMACRESCIVGETPVRAAYPPEAASLEKGRSLRETFAPRYPRPLSAAGISAGAAQATFSGGEWRVEVTLSGPRAAAVDDFFPYPLDDFVIAHSRITCRDGRIVMPLTPSRGTGAPPPRTIRGLIIIDGAGYEVIAPVASRPPFTPAGTYPILSWR